MQSINFAVLNPWFLGTFFGTTALCALLSILAIFGELAPDRSFPLVGSALYLLGSLGVTMVANVPRNEALARLAVDDPPAAERWADYVREWTIWNHVLRAASLAAALAYMLSRS